MVHHPLPQRDYYPSRENWCHERAYLDLPQESRFTGPPPPVHPRCLPVETALKECAGLSVKEFALIVLDENGDEKTYTSTSLTPHQQRIFTERFRTDFRRTLKRINQFPNSAYNQDGLYHEFGTDNHRRKQSSSGDSSSGRSRRHFQRQSRSADSDEEDSGTSGKRKRPRPSLYQGRYADNDNTPVPVQKTQQLVIGEEREVEQFYYVRFKDMQQSSCKIMGKAFVKLVEPKKQTHHPYTKGDIKAPPWWPDTKGENAVRHKEPDHLLKPERIRLLVHILKMVIEPREKQCSTVEKLGLNVKLLEEATMESMSVWFNDKDHPENGKKKVFLKEIFKVAKMQERYKNGEIDATTCVPVMYGDRNGLDTSDDEPEEGIKDEEEEQDPMPAPSGAVLTPDSLLSPAMMQSQSCHSSEPDTYFRMRLPVRQYNQTQLEESTSYPDGSYLARSYQTQSPVLNDPNRRSFASPGYQSPQQNMFWQNSMASNAPVSSNYYVTTQQQANIAQSTLPYQLPPPNSQQSMLPPPMAQHQFDSLPNQRYDSAPALGNQLRTGSLGHPHHMPHGFQEYLPDNGAYGQNESDLKDEHGHTG